MDVMADVAVIAVDIVDVVAVDDRFVAAPVGVDVHVPGVGQVKPCPVDRGPRVVHVVVMDVMDLPVVEEVHVSLVRDGGVAAEAVVDVRVLVETAVRGAGHAVPPVATVAGSPAGRNGSSGPR
jgi:hypothetical protein